MFLLVSYSLLNGFLIVEEKLGDLDKVPIKVKYQINAVGKYDNNFVLTRKTEIPSIVNTFENIFLHNYLYKCFDSSFYDDHDIIFSYLFRIFLDHVCIPFITPPFSVNGNTILTKDNTGNGCTNIK